MSPESIDLPAAGLVVLIGAAGAGKSTLAARLFDPADIVSSDDLRAAIGGDPADQRTTRTVFGILHREVRRRLAAGRLVVVDATNVEAGARLALVRLARDVGVPASAIAVVPPAEVVHARNAARSGRVVPADIVDRHVDRITALGAGAAEIAARLRAEGFVAVQVVDGRDDDAAETDGAGP